MERPASSFQIP